MANTLETLKKAKKKADRSKDDRPRPKSYSLEDDVEDVDKILAYGHTGTGKTYLLIGPLLAGLKLFVMSCDFGTNGLKTVRRALKKAGEPELLKNIRGIDLSTFHDVEDFLEEPLSLVEDLVEFGPDVLVFEGFSSFNIDILDEYILNHAPGAEGAGALRKAGWTHTQQDWQGMKRGTIRTLRKFLSFRLPDGKPVHKILTCLEANTDVNTLTNRAEKGVLVHGTGKALMGPAFDLILETYVEETEHGPVYKYRFVGDSGKYLVKSRGYDMKPVEIADPLAVWNKIRGVAEEQKDGI